MAKEYLSQTYKLVNNIKILNLKIMGNESLSARIRRRNKQGFAGLGSHKRFDDKSLMGDYRDPNQNGKAKDKWESNRKKSILGFKEGENSLMRKKFANNKQRR